MLGNGRLFEVQSIDDFSDGALLEGKEVKDIAAAGLGDGVEGVGSSGGARHGRIIHSHMGICQEEFLVERTSHFRRIFRKDLEGEVRQKNGIAPVRAETSALPWVRYRRLGGRVAARKGIA